MVLENATCVIAQKVKGSNYNYMNVGSFKEVNLNKQEIPAAKNLEQLF